MAVDLGFDRERLGPTWVTAAATALGYLLLLAVLTLVLFVVPWLLFGTL